MTDEDDEPAWLAAELATTGVPGQATIRDFRYLGQTRAGRTLVELDLEITAPGTGRVRHRSRIPLEHTAGLRRGATVPVILSSTDPEHLAVDWPGFSGCDV
jgi:hypothetical protein